MAADALFALRSVSRFMRIEVIEFKYKNHKGREFVASNFSCSLICIKKYQSKLNFRSI